MQRPRSPRTSNSVRQGAEINNEANVCSPFPEHVTRRSSSNGGQRKATASTRPTVSVHVAALGNGRWSDETGSSGSSIDCAVEVDAQRLVKETSHSRRPKCPRRCIRCITALIMLGSAAAAAVLVPVALIIGFNHRRPTATQTTIPQPPAAFNIILAFNNSIQPTAASILPKLIAEQVKQWVVLPSSSIHIATFGSLLAMQQALAALANTTSLKYAVADFNLIADRSVSSLVNPDKLLELSKLPARHLMQETINAGDVTSRGTTQFSAAGRAVAVPEASRLVATHKQRLAERKMRRQLLSQGQSLASAHMPSTARTHQRNGEGTTVGITQQLEPFSCSSTGCMLVPAVPHVAAAINPCPLRVVSSSSRAYGTLCAKAQWSNTSGADAGAAASLHRQRQLKQYQEPPPPPEPQPQQRQAVTQPQRGGTGVAWYLADPALQTKQAWNITYGLDEVIVAVIDSGIELSHGGVGAAVWANAGEIAADGLDNDGNGFIDDVMGWDFGGSCIDAACSSCAPSSDPSDVTGWGTHAAAVVAAQPEVTSGTSGIAPGVRVMALKISDCRGGTQLADYSSQQLAAGYKSVEDSGGNSSEWSAASAGPAMLGSAAVQALDYAVLNGAHIVLAAWQAGDVIDVVSAGAPGSSQSSASAQSMCVLGADAAAAATTANGTAAACITAVQEYIFRDAIKPLEQAGLLVISMQPTVTDRSSTAIPCKLGLDMSNILCVSTSQATEASATALNEQVPAPGFFDALIYTMNRNLTAEAEKRDEAQLPDKVSNNATVLLDHDATRLFSSGQNLVQLKAPGSNILAGWAWGSHAVVSGSSAAAAVAAGAAALTWSALGQGLGAEASARAHEGLGKYVRQLLTNVSSGETVPVSYSGSTAALLMDSGTPGTGGLDLLRAVQAANNFTGPLELHPAQISPSVTTMTSSLSYSWYITTALSGPYITDQMAFVARKALQAPYFPLTNWEFYGSTSLVEVEGFIAVDSPGNYSLAAESADKFIVWLDDKWLMMQQVGDAGTGLGLPPAAWLADVHFQSAGYYRLRVVIYSPGSSSFDLKWRTPLSSRFAAISQMVSFGRNQPLAQQLVDQVTGHMLQQAGATITSRTSGGGSGNKVNSEYSNLPDGAAGSGAVSATSDAQPLGDGAVAASRTVDTTAAAPVDSGSSGSTPQPQVVDAGDATASATVAADPVQHDEQQSGYVQPEAHGMFPNAFNPGGLGSFLNSLFGWERGGTRVGAAGGSSSQGAAKYVRADAAKQQPSSAVDAVRDGLPVRPSRSLHGAQWMNPTRTITPVPGVFSVAAALVPPTGYRTILPALKDMSFSHVGILEGPTLQVTSDWKLQQLLLGLRDISGDQAGYGVAQGWLDWKTLNPEAYDWLQSDLGATGGGGSSAVIGDVIAGTAGVQFELACASGNTQMSCSLHLDGQVLVGSLDETQESSCIVPSRRQLGSSSINSTITGAVLSSAAAQQQLVHIELLFAADDMRAAKFSVRARPCNLMSDGSVQVPSGSSGTFAALVATPGASALGLAAAELQHAAGSSYQPGMLCSIKATLPPGAGNISSRVLERTVYVTAEELQRTLEVDASSWQAPSVNNSITNDTRAEPTAKTVAGTTGIAVQQLVPDWVQSLPANTLYGFHCGCYWNGSWGGNVSVGVHAGGSGSAALYLAGWPVAASRLLPVYGPSDTDVTLYTSWQQQQQLLSGSSSADPLRWQDDSTDHRFPEILAGASTGEWMAAMSDLGFRPTQLLGGTLFPLGDVDGAQAFSVPAQSGSLQLLVIHGDSMDAYGRVVVAAAVPSAADVGKAGGGQAVGPAAAGWLPGPWDAWIPM